MEVYSSFPNSLNFRRSNIHTSSIYKRYALLFDRIIFNRHGCPIGEGNLFSNLHQYTSIISCEDEDFKERLKLSTNKKFKELFIDLWDVVEDPENTHREAQDYVSEFHSDGILKFSWGRNLIDEEIGIHNHNKEYKAAAIVGEDISSDLGFNFLLKSRYKNFHINFAPVVAQAVGSAQQTAEIGELFTTELVVPKFDELSWDQVLELREDKNIQAFRRKFFSIENREKSIDKILYSDLESTLWDLATQIKPSIGKSTFEAVVSNLPFPTVLNPFGLYYGIKSVIQNYKNKNSHSWIYFIQSMKT
ncbi:hypothetical protein HC231_02635 [Brenneria izadpanahii]|uniref:Uncharacterized protein n=1 Tax=Brenneria izadpanahii TaxID=2722756 RepID=A0ABX7URC4_9GAMM|nr:hypothetical protein [Brenneria izadpanahii]QTF06952.1 hypothetical protein HC231_02635 [Brenneria izadpanahii]